MNCFDLFTFAEDIIEEYGGFDDLEASIADVSVNETLSKREMTTSDNEQLATDDEDDEKMDKKKKNEEDESMHLSQSDSETVNRRTNVAGNDAGTDAGTDAGGQHFQNSK